MTPQLRQAIQLLQYSNIEVTSFIEKELERNPLLERDETADAPIGERAALDRSRSGPMHPPMRPRRCARDPAGGQRWSAR